MSVVNNVWKIYILSRRVQGRESPPQNHFDEIVQWIKDLGECFLWFYQHRVTLRSSSRPRNLFGQVELSAREK